MKKRIMAFVLSLTVLLSLCQSSLADDSKSSDFMTGGELLTDSEPVTVAQSEGLTLSCNPYTGEFTVYDAVSGKTYFSNPLGVENDQIAKGAYRAGMRSQLILTAENAEGSIESSYNSFGYSVGENGLKTYRIDGGVRLEYTFPELEITVPMTVRLKDGGMVTEVSFKNIKENGKSRLLDVAVLPFFGCAKQDENGYFLIPDGSGAIFGFDSKRSSFGQYRKTVYGADEYSGNQFLVNNGETVSLPLFGACFVDKDKSNGFLATAQKGAANAELILEPAGMKSGFTNTYFNFIYREHTTAVALDRTYAQVSYDLIADDKVATESVQVEYDFLRDNADYCAMAGYVRNRLAKQGVGTDRRHSLVLDVYNTVVKLGYTLGIPHKQSFVVTDFEATENIVNDFSGASLAVHLIGWEKQGATESTVRTDYAPASTAGGKKALENLIETAHKSGNEVYLNAELTRFSKSKWGYTTFFDSAKSVLDKSWKLFPYRRSTLAQDTTKKAVYLLRSDKVLKAAKSLDSALPDTVSGVAASSLTNRPYSDYRKGTLDRNSFTEIQSKALSVLSENRSVYAEKPSYYALPRITVAADLPLESSQYDLFDRSVPFLPLVLRGLMTVSSTPVNLSGEPRELLLKSIEAGIALKFSFTEDASELSSTDLNTLYGSTYSLWRNQALDLFSEWKEAMSGLENQDIISQKFSDGNVSRTEYANGTVVLVNCGCEPVSFGGTRLDAMSWARTDCGGDVDA